MAEGAPGTSAAPASTPSVSPSTPSTPPAPPGSPPSSTSPAEPLPPPLPGVLPDGPAPPLRDARQVVQDASPADAPAQPDPAAPRFQFGGEEFESQEAAEQNFRSLRGQFKPLQALAKDLGGMERILPTLKSAADSARSWQAEAQRLQAELAAVRAAPAAAPSPSTPTAPAPDAADPSAAQDTQPSTEDVDWELYAEIKRVATESGEPWKAEQWLINETRRIEQSKVEKLLDERLAPFREAQAREAVLSQTETLWSSLAEYVNTADGSPAFPELQDSESAFKIGRTWAQMGLPPEFALTPNGAIAAIALYRMMSAAGASQGSPPNGSVASPPAPPTPSPSQANATAAAELDGGRPVPTAPPQPLAGVSAEAARIKAGLRQAHANASRGHLGFDW